VVAILWLVVLWGCVVYWRRHGSAVLLRRHLYHVPLLGFFAGWAIYPDPLTEVALSHDVLIRLYAILPWCWLYPFLFTLPVDWLILGWVPGSQPVPPIETASKYRRRILRVLPASALTMVGMWLLQSHLLDRTERLKADLLNTTTRSVERAPPTTNLGCDRNRDGR
jgi:hypothetical protein